MNESSVQFVVPPQVRYGVQSRWVLWAIIFGGMLLLYLAGFTAIDKYLFHTFRLGESLAKSVVLSAVLTAILCRKSDLMVGNDFILGSYSVMAQEKILRSEVQTVREIPQRFLRTGAGLLVVGVPRSLRRSRAVLVPASIPNYEQIKARLMQWPVTSPVE